MDARITKLSTWYSHDSLLTMDYPGIAHRQSIIPQKRGNLTLLPFGHGSLNAIQQTLLAINILQVHIGWSGPTGSAFQVI